MKVNTVRSFGAAAAESAIVGIFPDLSPAPGNNPVLKGLKAWVKSALETSGFEGKLGTTSVLVMPEGSPVGRVAFVGLGDDLDVEGLRQAAGSGRRALAKSDSIATALHQLPIDGAVGAVLDGIGLADYRYDKYKSTAEERSELAVELVGSVKDLDPVAERSAIVVDAVDLARDLVNEPSKNKAPMAFADRLGRLAELHGIDVEIWDVDKLESEAMSGLLGVGLGSHRPPCLLKLTYRPRRPKAKLALVGKGIVFDSGGLSLKSAEFMMDMKDDMGGAAAVSAAVLAIARLGVKVEVTAYAALAENMPGGGAQRPGDVLTIRNGKTIEVLNTDAEGRLVLADALALAAESEPDLIVDLATLTGACKVALGPKIAGVFSKVDEPAERVLTAARAAGERMWHMPMPADYRPFIDSNVADMKNTGKGRYGGAQSAALLLAEFVGDAPWAHIDIAGPAFVDSEEHYIPKGGTGFGVRSMIELAESMA
jgi:leucyl aminopeptidase